MEIQEMDIERIIGAEGQRPENLPNIDEGIWILKGTKADVIYADAGNGWCAVLHVAPKTLSLEEILKAILAGIPS